MKIKHILRSLFFSILSLQPISANVILYQDTKVLMDVDVIQDFNDQNYTIEKGATLIMESGATLRNIDTLIINGTLDAQNDSSFLNLRKLINNGEMITTPYIKYIPQLENLTVSDTNTSNNTNTNDINNSITLNNTTNNESSSKEENQNTIDDSNSIRDDSDKENTNNEAFANQETAVLGISQDNNEVHHNAYIEKDVSTINNTGIFLLVFLSSMLTLYFLRKEKNYNL